MKLKIDDDIVEAKNADEDIENGNFDLSRTHTNKEQCIRNLKFLRGSYLAQLHGVEKKLHALKIKLGTCIVTDFVIVLAMAWLISVGTRFPFAFSMFAYVGIAYLMVLLFKCNRELIIATISYGIHFEKKGFQNMTAKYGLFTLEDEKAHCKMEISKINNMLDELKKYDAKQVDRKYWDYEYVEKYAFTEVTEFYDKNKIFIFLIFVIVFFVVLVGVAGLCIDRLVGFG